MYIIAGALFGVYEGFAIVFFGDVVGSAICFMISRRFGEGVMKFFIGKSYFGYVSKVLKLLENTKSFIKARLAFIGLPEIFAYAAGISNVNFWKFLIIHSLFFIPVDIAFILLGSSIAELSASHTLIYFLVFAVIAFGGILALFGDYKKLEAT